MEQWRIHKDRTRCEKPGCTLAADPEFYAILQLPDCVRIERCLTCFNELNASAEHAPFHWRVRRKDSGNKQPVLDLESLRRLFDRLGEPMASEDGVIDESDATVEEAPVLADEAGGDVQDEEESDGTDASARAAGLRYLVALLLLRKRRLNMVDATNEIEERADLVVIDPKVEGMEPVALFAPALDPEGLDNLRIELMVAIGEEAAAPSGSSGSDS